MTPYKVIWSHITCDSIWLYMSVYTYISHISVTLYDCTCPYTHIYHTPSRESQTSLESYLMWLCSTLYITLHLECSYRAWQTLNQIIHIYTTLYMGSMYFDRKNPPPPEGISYWSRSLIKNRTVSKRTPLEEIVPGASRGVLLVTVLDERK